MLLILCKLSSVIGLKPDLVLANQREDAVVSTNREPHSGHSQNGDALFGFVERRSLKRKCAKRFKITLLDEQRQTKLRADKLDR